MPELDLKERLASASKFLSALYANAPKNCKIQFMSLPKQGSSVITPPTFNFSSISELGARCADIIRNNNEDFTMGWFVRIAPVRPDFQGGGRGKAEDSIGTAILWADLDIYKVDVSATDAVAALLDTSKTRLPLPAIIVDSGAGIHAYWRLSTFETSLDSLKRRLKYIEASLKFLGSDSTTDLARVMRLPGTWNRKTETPKMVSILYFNPTNVFDVMQFPEMEMASDLALKEVTLTESFLERVKNLDYNLWCRIYSEETALAAKAMTKNDGTVDRSKNDAWIAVRLLSLTATDQMDITPSMVFSVLCHPEWFSGSKSRERGPEYAAATVKRAMYYVERIGRNDPMRFFDGRQFIPSALGEEILLDHHFLSTGGPIWKYDCGVYRPNAEQPLKHLIVEKLADKWRRNHMTAVVEWVTTMTYQSFVTDMRNCINLRNGVLHLTADTAVLKPHSPHYKYITQLNARWQEFTDDSPEVKLARAFLGEVLPKGALPAFEEFLGTCLLTDYRYKKALLLVGPGDCGKSTLINYISTMIGEENISSRSFQDLAGGNRFAKASLLGKLANVYADLPALEANDVGQFKAITGNDIIDAEYKGRDAIPFRNYAKMLFSANNFPKVKTPDEAFFNRWLVFHCTNCFVKPSEVAFVKAHLSEGGRPIKVADRTLIETLTQPNYLDALLWVAVKGLQRLLATGEFTDCEALTRALGEFMSSADPVMGFFNACSEPDMKAQATKEEWYSAFRMWCQAVGVDAISSREFFMRVVELRRRLGLLEIKNTLVERNGTKRQANVYRGRRLYDFIVTADGGQIKLSIPMSVTVDDN